MKTFKDCKKYIKEEVDVFADVIQSIDEVIVPFADENRYSSLKKSALNLKKELQKAS